MAFKITCCGRFWSRFSSLYRPTGIPRKIIFPVSTSCQPINASPTISPVPASSISIVRPFHSSTSTSSVEIHFIFFCFTFENLFRICC
ncbi:MAG: hypothetical protein EU547_06315 [Promethearchaeota archaeon]|nr:MAG: hypothetical protein EU547_06315 [Candidatus Lokiarchaeota archaeon]